MWVCLLYKLRWYSSRWCQISHGHIYTFLRLDNYTGLGQGLVALKTNAHRHRVCVRQAAISSLQPKGLLHSSHYTEPQWSHLLWNVQLLSSFCCARHSNTFYAAWVRSVNIYKSTWWSFMCLTVRVSSYLERHIQYAYREYSKTRKPGVPGCPLMNSIQYSDTDYRGPCRYRGAQYSRLEPLMIMSVVCADSKQVGVWGKAGKNNSHNK